MQHRRRNTIIAAAALVMASSAEMAHAQTSAQTWPSRVATIVVAFPAGGPTDVLARAVAADLADKLGQQFADGHTLLFATTSVVNNRFMYRNVSFDADRDFVPIILISKTPIVLVAASATGLKGLDTLIARAITLAGEG